MSLVSFFHAYIHAKNQNQILIYSISEYLHLIGWGTFFAITSEPDFFQACSFYRMLIKHKNFYFTQIPDKTNDIIFLKSPKTMILGHFWPFFVIFVWWDFFKKMQLCHTKLYVAPNTMLSFRKKLLGQSWENVWIDRRMDRRMDRPYFIGPFWPRLGVQ